MKEISPKLLLTTLAIGGVISANSLITRPTNALEANKETFDSPFIVTGLNPSKNEISFIFNGNEKRGYLTYLNIVYSSSDYDEGYADAHSGDLEYNRPYWVKTIYLQYMPTYTKGVERKLLSGEMKYGDLGVNPNGIIYFSAQMSSVKEEMQDNYYTGKVDYRACLNSSVYGANVECRAEIYEPTGDLIYYPYLDGIRLVAPDYKYPEVPGAIEEEPSDIETETGAETGTKTGDEAENGTESGEEIKGDPEVTDAEPDDTGGEPSSEISGDTNNNDNEDTEDEPSGEGGDTSEEEYKEGASEDIIPTDNTKEEQKENESTENTEKAIKSEEKTENKEGLSNENSPETPKTAQEGARISVVVSGTTPKAEMPQNADTVVLATSPLSYSDNSTPNIQNTENTAEAVEISTPALGSSEEIEEINKDSQTASNHFNPAWLFLIIPAAILSLGFFFWFFALKRRKDDEEED